MIASISHRMKLPYLWPGEGFDFLLGNEVVDKTGHVMLTHESRHLTRITTHRVSVAMGLLGLKEKFILWTWIHLCHTSPPKFWMAKGYSLYSLNENISL